MFKRLFFISFVAGFLSIANAGNGISLENGKYLLKLKDALSGQLLEGKIENVSKDSFLWHDDKGLNCRISLDRAADALFFGLCFSVNPGNDSRRLLSVELSTKKEFSETVKFWDGHTEHEWDGKALIKRDKLVETFPLSCVYGKNNGIAIGITPDTVTSWLESRVAANEISYTTKVVVDSAKEQKITFAAYEFKPNFGWKDAVEKYYGIYPDYFKPADGVDERIYGVGGYIGGANAQRDLELHSIRRMHMSWEWTYTPWQEAGRWATRKEDWKQGEHFYPRWDGIGKDKIVTWEEYKAALKKQFASGNKLCAMFFYILVKDIRIELVNQFPDSRMVKADGKPSGISALYSKFDQKDKSYWAFAYGSGLAPYLEKEIKDVVEDYDVSGFAFDMANLALYDYSPAQLKFAVGRCFDEWGQIYTPDSVLPIPFAEYIRTLKRGEKRMASYMNFALHEFVPFTVFHADGLMFEGNPERNMESILPLRLMSGQKPFTFWGGITNQQENTGVKWDYYKNPKIRKEMDDGFAQLLLFFCLKYGATPQNWSAGHDNCSYFASWIPTLVSLKKAGWRCVPAVKTTSNEKLWIGRFGKGIDTVITITNPTRETVKDDLEILFPYIGDKKYIFISGQGQALTQKISSGSAKFSIEMKPKEIMVLRTFEFEGPENAELLTQQDISSEKITIRKNFPCVVKGNRSDFAGNIVSVDNKLFAINSMDSGNITLETASLILVSGTEKDIEGFFTLSDAENMAKQAILILPENPSANEKTVSEMLDRYYPYVEACRKYNKGNWEHAPGFLDSSYSAKWKMQASTWSKAKDSSARKICIGSLEDFPELKSKLSESELADITLNRDGFIKLFSNDGILWIGGKNESGILSAGNRYFEILDKKPSK